MSGDLEHTDSKETQLITEPCARFLKESRNLILFLVRTHDLADTLDKMLDVLADNLHSIKERASSKLNELDQERKEHFEEDETKLLNETKIHELLNHLDAINEAKPFLANILVTHRQLLLELLLCRAVDNFLTYISEGLALIYRTRPETLRSNETERLDVILQYKSMDELIAALAEKRVNDLSYLGLLKLSDHLSTRLGFHLFEQSDDLVNATRIVELRNIIVHNRAVINNRFLTRVPNFPAAPGDTIVLDRSALWTDFAFLREAVKNIDTRAANKFNLPTPVEKDTLW